MDQLRPQKANETPFIFTEEGKQQAFKAIDKGVKYAKVAFFGVLAIILTLSSLIIWVIFHFLHKHW
jgi:hypothetical protein